MANFGMISALTGVSNIFDESMHGKCAIYSTWKIYVATIYRVYPTRVGMSHGLVNFFYMVMGLSHTSGNESKRSDI